ncbi:MAG: hypothetical protein AB1679_22170 [Actinomycetota bacterium]
MFRRRACITLALVASVFVAGTLPAHAEDRLVKKKSFSENGRRGSASWYQDKDGDEVTNYFKITADDKDGSGGKCTETWVDYSTKPHRHYNPGVVVNCAGGDRTLSRFHVNDYYGIRGFGLIVCEVPNTSGRITRNSSNCSGNLGSMYLHSGKRYSQFAVKATRYPNGILFYEF